MLYWKYDSTKWQKKAREKINVIIYNNLSYICNLLRASFSNCFLGDSLWTTYKYFRTNNFQDCIDLLYWKYEKKIIQKSTQFCPKTTKLYNSVYGEFVQNYKWFDIFKKTINNTSYDIESSVSDFIHWQYYYTISFENRCLYQQECDLDYILQYIDKKQSVLLSFVL